MMNRLRWLLRGEAGFALPMALVLMVLGGLLIVPSVALVGTSLNAHRVADELDHKLYAADAGMEHGIWRLIYDDTFALPSAGGQVQWQLAEQINGATVTVTFRHEATDIYKIVSTATAADGSTITVEAYAQYSQGGNSIFNNAVVALNGDINMANNSRVHSNNYPDMDGDVYANGNVIVNTNAVVDGDASATGTITGGGSVNGVRTPGADRIDGDALWSQMSAKINDWKADAMNIACAACSYSYTRTANPWTVAAGAYNSNEYVQYGMRITATSGTWDFMRTVCVGAFTNNDLTISGGGTKTFYGPVNVGRNLVINASSGTVTFKDSVCVGGNLLVSGGATIVFEGKVKVGGLRFGNSTVPPLFRDTVWVLNDVTSTANGARITLGAVLYVQNTIVIDNSAWITGGQNIIADGDILIRNNAGLNLGVDPMVIPFLISTGGNVTIENNTTMTRAIVYAPAASPNGVITMGNNGNLMGSVVGRRVDMANNTTILYPIEFRSRTDLPGTGGGSPGAGLSFKSYTVNP